MTTFKLRFKNNALTQLTVLWIQEFKKGDTYNISLQAKEKSNLTIGFINESVLNNLENCSFNWTEDCIANYLYESNKGSGSLIQQKTFIFKKDFENFQYDGEITYKVKLALILLEHMQFSVNYDINISINSENSLISGNVSKIYNIIFIVFFCCNICCQHLRYHIHYYGEKSDIITYCVISSRGNIIIIILLK